MTSPKVAFLFLCICTFAVIARNHYDVLGISRRSTSTEIKKQYRNLAKKYHPDKNKGDQKAKERFIELSAAYETLSDDEKRQHYDQEIKFGDPQHNSHLHRHQEKQQWRQQHFQFQDQGDEEMFMFQSPDGRIFTTTRNRRHFQQHHHFNTHRASNSNPFFGFETFNDELQLNQGWWGYVQLLYWSVVFGMNILIMLLVGIHAISPVALLLVLMGLMMCCVPSKYFDVHADNGRQRRGNHRPPPPPPEENNDLIELTDDDLSARGNIVVVSSSNKGKISLLSLKNRYKRDPIKFYKMGPSKTTEREEWDESYDIIASSKGGKQWTGIRITGTDGCQSNLQKVDMWLLRLIGGEVQWTLSTR